MNVFPKRWLFIVKISSSKRIRGSLGTGIYRSDQPLSHHHSNLGAFRQIRCPLENYHWVRAKQGWIKTELLEGTWIHLTLPPSRSDHFLDVPVPTETDALFFLLPVWFLLHRGSLLIDLTRGVLVMIPTVFIIPFPLCRKKKYIVLRCKIRGTGI